MTVFCYTINNYKKYQTAFRPNAETSMITKLLLASHLLGHLIAWITIRQYLNEFTYISICFSVLICLSVIKLGNTEWQPWIEAHAPSRPDELNLNAILSSWITPATLLTKNTSELYFRRIVSPLQRKIIIVFTAMATALIQLVHLCSIALLLNIKDVFKPSTYITVAR